MLTILFVGDNSPPAFLSSLDGCTVKAVKSLGSAIGRMEQEATDILIVNLVGFDSAPLEKLEDLLGMEACRQCATVLIVPEDDWPLELDPSLLKSRSVEVIQKSDDLDSRLATWLDFQQQTRNLRKQIAAVQQEQQAGESLLQKLVHDMKSPLTVMLIELGMLERWWEKGKAERFRNGVIRLTQNCEELIEMIQNLLDIHRIRKDDLEIRFTRLGLAPVLREVLDNPPSILKKRGIQTDLDLRDTESPLSMDPALINRVLVNLLKVSARLSPQKGRILLSARNLQGRMLIRVECRGRSITGDDCRALFDQYAHKRWRALGLDAGSGIGLNFGKLIVEAHQGRLSVESRPDKGATFSIELPMRIQQLSSRAAGRTQKRK